METTLRLLLLLSRKLVRPGGEGAIAEALPLILAATGSVGGALYLRSGEALELAAQSGMPAGLRSLVERLDPEEPSWFVAQRAAESKALTLDRELHRCEAQPFAAALHAAGWEQAAARPLIVGGELYGVVVIAAPAAQEISAEALGALELGGNIIALHLASVSRTRASLTSAETTRASLDRRSTRETEPGPAAAA